MSPYFDSIDSLPTDSLYESKLLKTLASSLYQSLSFLNIKRASGLGKTAKTFINLSRQTEQRIRQLEYVPDLVFHIHGMYNPFWENYDIPYVTYLDYTMALAHRSWKPWAPFSTENEFSAWLECERKGYEQATHLFTMSNCVKSSLVEDYGIDPSKITTIYSAGQFSKPEHKEKYFGNKQILFNGSDFERKGGDLVLAAFREVRHIYPEAKLVIVGINLSMQEDNVYNPGYVSSQEMRKLFLETDIVVSPARCDPFALFLIEAMNFGVPCIVSEQDGMPEIVEHRVNGIVIPQPTADLLASQMLLLLPDHTVLEEMSKKARHKVESQFNWNAIAKKISATLVNI
jgi:glycosyltransferase involved in cell wall biosynthesis